MRRFLTRAYRVIAANRNESARAAVRSACVETLESRQLLSTYYVSAAGSDSNSGTSTGSAWKSISRVNSATLHAGDTINFRGGDTFSGGLVVNSGEGGSSS